MAVTVKELLAQAKAKVRLYSAEEAIAAAKRPDVLLVDVRDEPELRSSGKAKGAVHASRGMLEFHLDPTTPSHKPELLSGKELIFYCRSGGRSALAAQRAAEMGVARVASLEGGFPAWEKGGGEVERL